MMTYAARFFPFLLLVSLSESLLNPEVENNEDNMAQVSDCESRAPRYFIPREKTALCLGSLAHNDMPAECAQLIRFPRFSSSNAGMAISLCANSSSIMPALCYNALPKHLKRETQTRLCQGAPSTAPAECAKLALSLQSTFRILTEHYIGDYCHEYDGPTTVEPLATCLATSVSKKLSPDLKVALCHHATSSVAVTSCFDTLANHPGLRHHRLQDLVSVCQHATSTSGPAQCFTRMTLETKNKKSWTPEQILQLCRETTFDTTSECALSIKSKKFGAQDRIALCAQSDVSPAKCVNALSPRNTFSLGEILALCAQISPELLSSTTSCLSKLPTSLRTNVFKLRLCAHASSVGPASCFRVYSPLLNDPVHHIKLKVELCAGAQAGNDDGPHRCLSSVSNPSHSRLDTLVQLCQRATSDAPAQCYNQAPFGWNEFEALSLCRQARSVKPVQCAVSAPASLGITNTIELCQGATSLYPAECARRYTGLMPTQARGLVELCKDAPLGIEPALCYVASPASMTTRDRIRLCQGATSLWPAHCAAILSPMISSSVIASVCHNASSLTPGLCLLSYQRDHQALTSSVVISECQAAVARVSRVELESFSCQCPELVMDCSCSATVRLVDQYGGALVSGKSAADTTTTNNTNDVWIFVTTVKAFQEGKDALVGTTRVQSQDGRASFHNLAFTREGRFELRFASPGLDSASMIAQVYLPKREIGLKEGCQRMFHYLQSRRSDSESLEAWPSRDASSAQQNFSGPDLQVSSHGYSTYSCTTLNPFLLSFLLVLSTGESTLLTTGIMHRKNGRSHDASGKYFQYTNDALGASAVLQATDVRCLILK